MQRRTFLKLSAAAGMGTLIVGMERLLAATLIPAPFPVYLTFEGGPIVKSDGTGTTIDVLNVLNKYQSPATFFVTGRNLHDWDNVTLARMLAGGHAIGNKLYQDQGNTAQDQSTPSQLAEQYLKTEKRIRALIQGTNADVVASYGTQAKLYRRPGGDTALGTFLDPANYDDLAHEPFLKAYEDSLDWLKVVYDYSGWHVSAGDAQITSKKKLSSVTLARRVVNGEPGVQGMMVFLCVTSNNKRAHETAQGLVVQLFDNDKLTADAVSSIILQLRTKGAQFYPLPRTGDQPNLFTLGVEDLPTPDDSALACNAMVTVTPTSNASALATLIPTDATSPDVTQGAPTSDGTP